MLVLLYKGCGIAAYGKMNRHQARELAFALLFEHEFDKEKDMALLYDTAKETRDAEENKYVRSAICGVAEKEAELEALISEAATGWDITRISKVSLAILKLAAYEMLYCSDIPIRVSLNEAIELAKAYDDEGARGFVNGILHTLSIKAREKRPDEA